MCLRNAANSRIRQITFHFGREPWSDSERETSAKLAEAGFIRFDTGSIMQCVYCLEKVDFGLQENKNRHPMLVHAEKNLECALVIKRLTSEQEEPWPLTPLANADKQAERKNLWDDIRQVFVKPYDNNVDGVECG